MNNKPNVFACLFYTLLGLIGFFVIYAISLFILAFAIDVAARIPLIGYILWKIFEYDFVLYTAATIPALFLVSTIANRAILSERDSILTHRMMSVVLVIMQVILMFINIRSGNSWASNAAVGLAGIRMYSIWKV